jgi:hypothetical protein
MANLSHVLSMGAIEGHRMSHIPLDSLSYKDSGTVLVVICPSMAHAVKLSGVHVTSKKDASMTFWLGIDPTQFCP